MDRRSFPSSARDRLAGVLDAGSHAIQRRFEIDSRALAAFRIALGSLLLADLALRSRDLEAFYTDAGVLPRAAWAADYSRISFHAVSGDAWVQGLLFLIAGLWALALLVGYRTRLSTVVSWLLLLSLHARNPMILNGGDSLLAIFLFWGIFLPLGRRWSIDARRRTGSNRSVSSPTSSSSSPSNPNSNSNTAVATVATMALLCQVVLMYATNAIHKMRSDLWTNGDAIPYVFQVDQFTILLGNALAEHATLLRVATFTWMVLVVTAPLLVVFTGRKRAVLTTLFVGMHLGMLVTMRLDLFPLAVVAGLLPFYPQAVWDAAGVAAARLEGSLERRPRAGLASALADAPPRVRERFPLARPAVPDGLAIAPFVPGTDARAPAVHAVTRSLSSAFARVRAFASTALPLFFLVLVVLSNAQAVGYAEVPDPGERVLETTDTEQGWRMFAPNPVRTTHWYVAPGTLSDGTRVDALSGSTVEWERPARVEDTVPTARWRKYLSNVRSADNENHHSYLGSYLCQRWNDDRRATLEAVTIHALSQRDDPYGESGSVRVSELHEHDCSGPLVQ